MLDIYKWGIINAVQLPTVEEMRLMNIVANQAAAIIENVLLVQQARARAAF